MDLKYFVGDKEEDDLTMYMILKEVEFKSGTVRRNMYKNSWRFYVIRFNLEIIFIQR